METIEKIDELIKTAVLCNLRGVDFLQSLPIETVREAYNGIGPEFLPPSVREAVTTHFAVFAPAAVIHDLRNEFSDGTHEKFHAANDEFLRNCLALIDHKYPWWRFLRRDAARQAAYAFYKFVESQFGWRAWLEAQAAHAKKMASGNSAGERKEQT